MASPPAPGTESQRDLSFRYDPQPPPPPPFPLTTAFNDSFRYSNSSTTDYQTKLSQILLRILSAVIIAVCLFFAVCLIFGILFKPHVPDFAIDSAFLSSINETMCSILSAKLNLTFRIENPNYKLKIHYHHIHVQIMDGDNVLSNIHLPNFVQNDGNVVFEEIKVNLTAVDSGGYNIVFGEKLGLRGNVIHVRVLGLIRFGIGGLKTNWKAFKVFCGDLRFGVLSGRNGGVRRLIGGHIDCEVG